MNPRDLAKTFTDMCAKGEFDAAGEKFWSDDIVSREPIIGDIAVLKGRKAVEGKVAAWNNAMYGLQRVMTAIEICRTPALRNNEGEWLYGNGNLTVHNIRVEGPYVHGDQFVVHFKIEVTPKGGQRMNLDDVGLYTVQNGKIVEERFFMGGP